MRKTWKKKWRNKLSNDRTLAGGNAIAEYNFDNIQGPTEAQGDVAEIKWKSLRN